MINKELWQAEGMGKGTRAARIRYDVELFQKATATLIAIVLVSAAYFHHFEHWSFFNSIYFTIVTMATVGYGDLTPHTVPGKLGAMVMILTGIGAFGTFINLFVTRQHQVREERRRRQQAKES